MQSIKIRDLKGTKIYDRLKAAHEKQEKIPTLVASISKIINDVPQTGEWSQNFEDTTVHIERVISYWSRILKSAERNYSPTEREALALKEGLIKFQPSIEGEKIIAITDHAALIWSKTFQNINRRLLSWGTIFAAYPDLHIIHRAGRVHSNVNVDPISRLRRRVPFYESPLPANHEHISLENIGGDETLTQAYEYIAPRFEEKLLNILKTMETQKHQENTEDSTGVEIEVPILTDQTQNDTTPEKQTITYVTSETFNLLITIDPEEIKGVQNSYQNNPYFRKVFERLTEEEEKEITRQQSYYPQFTKSEKNLPYFEDCQGNQKLCIGKQLVKNILAENRDQLSTGAHEGYHKTYNRISMTYYWPRMSRDVRNFIQSCDICQKVKARRHGPLGLLMSLAIQTRLFEVIAMDLVIMELPMSKGFNAVLVIVDKLTKYGIFIPTTTSCTSASVAHMVLEHVIAHYGLFNQVASDRDRQWISSFWKELCTHLGIKSLLSTSYHPLTDGQTEILNQVLEMALRAYVGPDLTDWAKMLAPFTLSYNSSVHTTTGYSPAFLL